jgi:transposase-like protein
MEKYSRDIRESFIRKWRTSGKSILAFCAEKGINNNTFQYWLKREKQTSGKGFVEITNKKQQVIFENGISIEAGKIKITLPSGNSKEELQTVITMLWTLVC